MGNKSYSKGISWFDDCRIPFVDDGDIKSQERAFSQFSSSKNGLSLKNSIAWGGKGEANETNTQGRFPANLLVCDDMLNDGVISKSSLFPKTNTPIFDTKQGWNDNNISGSTGGGFNDKGTNSRYYDIDKWFDKILND
jgi:hypothetical protein